MLGVVNMVCYSNLEFICNEVNVLAAREPVDIRSGAHSFTHSPFVPGMPDGDCSLNAS